MKGVGTQLLVLIRLPESVGLKGTLLEDEEAEAKPEDVRSKPFGVVFPIGPDGRPESLKAAVQIDSPDFLPPRQTKNIFVWPDKDSDIVSFMLTPKRTGRLRVLVELQWEDALRGSRSLRTECLADASGVPDNSGSNVVRVQLDIGDRAAKTGEFTSFFQEPFRGDSSSDMPAPSSQPMEPPKKTVGDFTALFGPATPPSATQPAPPANAPHMQGPAVPPSAQPVPSVPPVNVTPLTDPVFVATPIPAGTPTPSPASAIPQSPGVAEERPSPARMPSTVSDDTATGAFMHPKDEPVPVPVEVLSGPRPYTQILSRPKQSEPEETEGGQAPAANAGAGKSAAPSMPKIPGPAPPPMPRMPPPPGIPQIKARPTPKAPKIDTPAPPPVSMWPLTITLTVLFFLAVIVVLFFVLKH